MASAHSVGKAFFPLDEELALLPGHLTPHAHECLVRFGAWGGFDKARAELAFVLQVPVSEPTARRYVEAAGAAYEAYQTTAVTRLEQETPVAPAGPTDVFCSVDGAMIPLVGGEWTEVKTLTLGEIAAPVLENGEWVVHSRAHSYFSRHAEASVFRRLALVETHQRGLENAQRIAAVTDGAEWVQGFIDFHCPQAVRILDFPHAGEHLSPIGQAIWGAETPATQAWLAAQLHQLKHAGPEPVLKEIQTLAQQHPTLEGLRQHQAYLEKRAAHMQYPTYREQGLPIGSGAMESGNKLVVEARLKGAGMHWAVAHVNPMLALRNMLCSDRWAEAWPHLTATLRQQAAQRRLARHAKRHPVTASPPPAPCPPRPITPTPIAEPPPPTRDTPSAPTRPAAHHPWRHSPIGKAQLQSTNHFSKN